MRIVEIAVLATPLALALPARAQVAAPQPPAIVTNAEAHADAPADRATVFVAVETRAATAAAAAAENSRLTKATLDTLRAIGLAREQLGTSGYSVQPQYTQRNVTGYLARNTVRVEIQKIDEVGRAIDAALAGGANSIGSLQFTASNADSARREALARATVQARGDAEVLARSAGGTLGPLIELTASGDNGIRPIMYARAMAGGAAAAPTPIDAGPITITVTVNVRWQFVPANR
ncbi:MAG TPA: SIMPL domain-containing protein [Gemmatimonadaceae bacterium]|nr:SIMPL domain-containing protein [Gemmatimonadaceae bacterium]